ncbi:Maltose phosphorylase [compost metagenome]
MNIVYGFGGMRSDGERLSFSPTLPERWTSYSFHVQYEGVLIRLAVAQEGVQLQAVSGGCTEIMVYGQRISIGPDNVMLPLAEGLVAG